MTLTDLKVMNDEAIAASRSPLSTGHAERIFRENLVIWFRSPEAEKVFEDAERHAHDCPTAWEFFNKYALGSKTAPSCFMCGHIVHERAIQHAELPDIYICTSCVARKEQGHG